MEEQRGGGGPGLLFIWLALPNHVGFDLQLKSMSGLGNRIKFVEIDFDFFCWGKFSFDVSVSVGNARKMMAGGLGWCWAMTGWW
jgi:hypothetical protein